MALLGKLFRRRCYSACVPRASGCLNGDRSFSSSGQQQHTAPPFSFAGAPFDRSQWKIHPDLEPYIAAPSDPTTASPGKQFGLTFLGTGAGTVSLKRGCSASALYLGGTVYLFDAGEGIQRRLMQSRIRMGDITKIFITHLHGDHIFGLPGLLLFLQHVAKNRQHSHAIEMYGPVGLYNYVAASISLSCTELNYVKVVVYELTGGSRRWLHPGSIKDYSEFRHRGLLRRSVPQNKDGTWCIEEPIEIRTPEDASRYHSQPSGLYVRAAQVLHLTKLQCFGYAVQEPWTQPQAIDVEKAKAAGVQPGGKYKLLKAGFDVPSDDGLRTVQPEDVWNTDELPYKARKLAILGDCAAVPRPMMELCRNADILVHEATFMQSDTGDKVDFGGHSSAAMAGKVAEEVGAKTLVLNHISSTNQDPVSEAALVNEAAAAIQGPTKVQLSYDLMDIHVPRRGFPDGLSEKSKSTQPEGAS